MPSIRKYRRDTSEVSCCLKYVIFGVNVLFWVSRRVFCLYFLIYILIMGMTFKLNLIVKVFVLLWLLYDLRLEEKNKFTIRILKVGFLVTYNLTSIDSLSSVQFVRQLGSQYTFLDAYSIFNYYNCTYNSYILFIAV